MNTKFMCAAIALLIPPQRPNGNAGNQQQNRDRSSVTVQWMFDPLFQRLHAPDE